jgi:hypothetical protein
LKKGAWRGERKDEMGVTAIETNCFSCFRQKQLYLQDRSSDRALDFCPPVPGTDVMIFKIFSPKKLSKKLAFLTQNKAKF